MVTRLAGGGAAIQDDTRDIIETASNLAAESVEQGDFVAILEPKHPEDLVRDGAWDRESLPRHRGGIHEESVHPASLAAVSVQPER
jgi:hypothetical protein